MPLREAVEVDKIGEINAKIAELKKRILLAEGQKTANAAEWQKQNRINLETITTLKKEIKELTNRCGQLRNPLQRAVIIKEEPPNAEVRKAKSASATTAIAVGKMSYPIGARSVEDAIFLTDLKITEQRKQLDLLRHRFKCRKERLGKLVQQFRELNTAKSAKAQNMGEKPPETLEEDANRKLVCQLENEIHRTNVQWMEAEHIRKKYRSIEASLMNDAERFERSLRELEAALSEQQAEIDRLQQVHNEAIEMRDAAKAILQRQEQQAHLSQKTRERQALDFRKQVEARKLELERIGRKLFVENKTLVHQDSLGSSSGDQLTAKTETEMDETTQLQNLTAEMENIFKHLMEVSGATTPAEVYDRFCSQKESAGRLSYLRNAAEKEKSLLEAQKEQLTLSLEAMKFSDVKESEVNQEVIEKIKTTIADLDMERQKNIEDSEHTLTVSKFIKDHLSEMIFKLQEVDESHINLKAKGLYIHVENLPNFLANEAQDDDFIEILKFKLQRCQELSKPPEGAPPDIPKLEIESDELYPPAEPAKSPNVADGEKPQPMPLCYYNLLAGRAQRAAGTSSSSPEQAPAAAATPDEESEVPTRQYLKRQSVLIVDSKSRRKPFRPTPVGRRK
ncbi:probable DNA double-strand break repair Rad50 ATPase [Rhagoletis pomonella]|uniref:probable DNA double-strand break repair Rad50 ATPase n=1 Tax=Rhagoletis pomonella TaxID=28610 RepID=UPI00177FD78E|nr:probable DNA double-strand break repair Rad50 ATPase [Rhagoletis pomonella]